MAETRNARKKERRRTTRESVARRKSGRLIVTGLIAATVLLAGTVVLIGYNRQVSLRMGQILVAVDPGFRARHPALRAIHESLIRQEAASLPDPEAPVLRFADADALPRHQPEADVVLGPTGQAVAWDPLVLATDQRRLQLPERLTLEQLAAALGGIGVDNTDDGRVQQGSLVVAGDDPVVFAALIMYLSGEILGDNALRDLHRHLAQPSEAGEGSQLDWLDRLSPVLERLSAWRSSGILAENWTNVDAASLRNLLRQQRVNPRYAAFLMPRSRLSGLSFEERFHLRVVALPPSETSRSVRAIGSVAGVSPAAGPRNDAVGLLVEHWHAGPVQERIERDTPWTPVVLEGAPLNREHRDMVRAYRIAGVRVNLTTVGTDHPLLSGMRRELQEP